MVLTDIVWYTIAWFAIVWLLVSLLWCSTRLSGLPRKSKSIIEPIFEWFMLIPTLVVIFLIGMFLVPYKYFFRK